MNKEKLTIMRDFLKSKLREYKIIKPEQVNDFITTDFQVIGDSALGGYVARDGAFPYKNKRTGKTVVKYKDYKNLKEAYGSLDKVVGYGSKYADSHYESDDRMIGYWDDFKFVDRGMPGIKAVEGTPRHDPEYDTKMDIDRKHNRVWSRLNTNKPISELSDLPPEDLHTLPTSAKYNDLGYGSKQIVGKIHHIAVSLNKNEQDRCSAMGTACNISPIGDTHDQNITGDLTQDFDDTNGVLRVDTSQPPTNKKKKEKKTMGKKNKDKVEEIDEEEDKEDKEKDDMEAEDVADGENKIMTGGEKKYPKGKVDGDDPNVEEKIKGSPYQENQKIGAQSKDMEDKLSKMSEIISKQNDFIEGLKPIIESFNKRTSDMIVKDTQEIKEILFQAPYNYTEDYLKEKTLDRLKTIKEDFEGSKVYADYIEQSEDNGFVDKRLFNESGSQQTNMLEDFIASSQSEHWGWANKDTKSDFWKEGLKK